MSHRFCIMPLTAWLSSVLCFSLAGFSQAQESSPSGCVPPPAGLLGWWTGDHDVSDQTGVNPGSLVNGATIAAGFVGGALQFNGLDQYALIPNSPSLNPTDALTVEAWVYPTGWPRSYAAVIVSKDDVGANRQFSLTIDPFHTFLAHVTTTNGLAFFNGIIPAHLNTWQHVAMTYDGATLKLYVNGVLDTSEPVSGAIVSLPVDVRIGAYGGDGPYYFPGKIDEVAMYGRALSADEIMAIYQAGSAGKCRVPPPPSPPTGPTNSATIYVANQGNSTVRAFTLTNGADLGYFATNGVPVAHGIAVDSDGDVYVASVSGNFIRRFSSNGVDKGVFASNGVAGPRSLVFDSNGNLYVANYDNNSVHRFSPTGADLGGFITNGLANPTGMAFDAEGNLYVANYDLDDVKEYSPNGQFLRTVISNGLSHPVGIVVLPNNQGFYVANDFVGSVVQFDGSGNVVKTLATDLGRLFYLASDSAGNMYVTRVTANAIRKFSSSGEDLGDIATTGLDIPTGIAIHESAPDGSSGLSDGLVAYYPFNGNADDESGNGHDGTVNGAQLTVDRFGNSDSAYQFSNSSVVATGIPVNLSGPYTFSVWMDLLTFQRGMPLFELSDGGTCNGNPQLYQFNSEVLYAHCGSLGYSIGSASNLTNQWRHLVVTVENGMTTLYRDGVVIANYHDTWPATSAIMMTLGQVRGYSPLAVLDDIRVYDRALSAAEVQELHAAESLPPPPPPVVPTNGLVAYYPFNGNANDASGYGNGGTVSNALPTIDRFGTLNSAYYFNGKDAQIMVRDNAALQSLGSNYTFNTWAKFTTAPSLDSCMLIKSAGIGGQRKWTFWRHVQASPLGMGVLLYRPSDGQYQWNYDYPFETNRWYMLTFSSSETHCLLAVDGVVVSAQAGNLTLPDTTDLPLSIGGPEPGGYQWFNGMLDDIRIYNRGLSSNEIDQLYLAEAPAASEAPAIVSQPLSTDVSAGATVEFRVSATGGQPLTYQWKRNGANLVNGGRISGATGSVLEIGNVQPSDAGLYSVMVANSSGSTTSGNASLTVTTSTAEVRIVSVSANAGGLVSVPVTLTAGDGVNALGFSLTQGTQLPTSMLAFDSVALGSNAGNAVLVVNTNQLNQHRIGVAIALPANATFSSGVQEVALVRFHSGLLSGSSSPTVSLSFGDAPTVRELSSVNAASLPATYVNGTITLQSSGLEGDTAPRPDGDNKVGITDWVQVGRFVASLDQPSLGGEFQRADCAPRATLGDGQIKVTDWVQAGRYAAGLDPLVPAGGPTGAIIPFALPTTTGEVSASSVERALRAVGTVVYPGQTVTMPVTLDSQGDENAVSFSLNFDPTTFSYASATAAGGEVGLTINVNASQAAFGKVGIAAALNSGNSFSAGPQVVANIDLVVNASTAPGNYPITLGDQPVLRGVSDSGAVELMANYPATSLSVAPLPSLQVNHTGQGITLTWPATAAGFTLQSSSNGTLEGGTWTNVISVLQTNGNTISTIVPLFGKTSFYRLNKPQE